MKSKYVRIHSNVSIGVAPGLHYENVTKKDSDIPNRLKVNPVWPKMVVNIEAGSHIYPAEVAEWPAVLALQKDKVLTIGDYCNEAGEVEEKISLQKQTINEELKKLKSKMVEKKETISLDDIAAK